MRSSSGQHFIALDHVRALAAFMVFTWHFIHGAHGKPVPYGYAPALFPAALLDEGHVGVALFMTLSGYLFAKLLTGRQVAYGAFLWNRVLRLLPLLLVVLALGGLRLRHAGLSIDTYMQSIMWGWLLPTLPSGAWSITVEFHFYCILPLLLWMSEKSRWLPLSIIVGAIALRAAIYLARGEVESLAYWTIIGRIDQFVLGMLAFRFRAAISGRHAWAVAILLIFSAFYWCIDFFGGAYRMPAALWIVLPTIEGFAFAALIAWYDNSFAQRLSTLSRFIGHMGEYSYSIYLLHVLVVFKAAPFIDTHVMRMSNFYVACVWSLVCFLAMAPIGYLSYHFVELPFLRLRRPYLLRRESLSPATATSEQVA